MADLMDRRLGRCLRESLAAGAICLSVLHPFCVRADQVLPLPAEDQKELAALLGAGVVGNPLPSKPIDDPTVYFPLQERSQSYQLTSGKHAGETRTLRVARGQRPSGTPAWRFELSSDLFAFVNQASGGDLTMPAVADRGEGVVIVTTPANPFVLTGMKPGETRSFTQSVAVNYLDDPGKEEYSGSLNGTYTYVGTYQVTVPAGTYEAILLRMKFAGKVGPAHTEDTAYYLLAPGVGMVAMVSQEDVEAFWLIHIDTSSGKVLASS